MFPDWVDYTICAGIATGVGLRIWWMVKRFKEGIVKSREEIERGENRITWL